MALCVRLGAVVIGHVRTVVSSGVGELGERGLGLVERHGVPAAQLGQLGEAARVEVL